MRSAYDQLFDRNEKKLWEKIRIDDRSIEIELIFESLNDSSLRPTVYINSEYKLRYLAFEYVRRVVILFVRMLNVVIKPSLFLLFLFYMLRMVIEI